MRRIVASMLLLLTLLLAGCSQKMLSEDELSALKDEAYQSGVAQAQEDAKAEAEEQYQKGYDEGQAKAESDAQAAYDKGYQEGYDKGKEEAEAAAQAEKETAAASSGQTSRSVSAGGTTSSAASTSSSSDSNSVTVYVTNTGSKYHMAGCQYLRQSQHARTLSQAKSEGYTACSRCHPPQ